MAGKNNEVTTFFRADITDYQDSIKSLNRYISTVNNEFKNATKGSNDWSKSTDGLKAKLTQLNRSLTAQEQVLAELEKEYNGMDKTQAENKEAAQKLYSEINKVRGTIAKTKSDINKYNKSLDEMESESDQSTKSLKDLDKATEKVSDGFTVAKGAVAGFIANGLTALVSGAKNAIGSILGLADATREYRQTMATLEAAATDVGVSTDFIKDKFTDMMGVFNDEDSVTEGLNNLLTAGFDESNLDAITQQLEGASIKWKDTLKFEGLADGLQETLATGNAVGPFAELLERGGKNLDTFNEGLAGCTTEADKQNFVLDQLSKMGLSEVSESYREQNKDMVDAQTANANYQNSLATLGDKIEPVTTKIREGFTKILDKMIELVDGVDLEAFAGKIEGAFTKFVDDIIPKIVSGLKWILDNKDPIIAGILAIGSAFVAWKAVSIITAVIQAIKGMSAAFKVLNAVMKANIIGIIVSLIAALVAAFIYLWKNCEGFRKFWQNLWAGIKSAAKAVADWIGGAFSTAWNAVKKAWSSTKKFFADIWNGIKNTFKSVGSFFSNAFNGAVNAIKKAFGNVASFFTGIWNSIKNMFVNVGTAIGDAVSGAFKKAINGVLSFAEKIINGFIKAINGAIKYINKIPGVSIKKLSLLEVPKLAKGGIVDKPTLAQIGEAGKEAVIPLEKNTQGLKKIAQMVADELKASGGGMTINNTYNQTFTNMPTTRYAMKKAMADSSSMYQLLKAMQGGV